MASKRQQGLASLEEIAPTSNFTPGTSVSVPGGCIYFFETPMCSCAEDTTAALKKVIGRNGAGKRAGAMKLFTAVKASDAGRHATPIAHALVIYENGHKSCRTMVALMVLPPTDDNDEISLDELNRVLGVRLLAGEAETYDVVGVPARKKTSGGQQNNACAKHHFRASPTGGGGSPSGGSTSSDGSPLREASVQALIESLADPGVDALLDDFLTSPPRFDEGESLATG